MNTGNEKLPGRIPALIFHEERTGSLKVAGLAVLDRLVVALHRAGAGPISVVSDTRTLPLKRAIALGVPVEAVTRAESQAGPVLITRSELIVRPADLALLLKAGGRLASAEGTPLPIGVLPDFNEKGSPEFEALTLVRAEGLATSITDTSSARAAERDFWGSLTSSADGLVDRWFNRPCGRVLSKVLVHTNLSPNTVSVGSILIGLLAAWYFAAGDYTSILAAALIFQLSAIVDCVDGDLARVLFKESNLGKWLDLAGDQVVHVGVLAGIATGLSRRGFTPAFWLGLSAVAGALLSFAVVLRGMRSRNGKQSALMTKLIDSVTNRDFSVLVLVLACVDRLQWFLWLAAVGSHVFWIAALAIQGATSGRRATQ